MPIRNSLPLSLLVLSAQFVSAAPFLGFDNTVSTAPVSVLSTEETDAFIRPAMYSQVSYCSSGTVLGWTCGPPCDALQGIQPLVGGGDDGRVPMYFIAYDTISQSIVVTHQGTNTKNILSLVNDVELLLVPLEKALFPNVSSSIQVHDGFQQAFARTALQVLGNVTKALASKGVNKVEVHGHSLGAAIAVMDAVFLRQHLDPNITIKTVVFGLPRGGNQAWADFVDHNAPGLVHIHNKDDPISTVPPRILGYQHPSGEIHIHADTSPIFQLFVFFFVNPLLCVLGRCPVTDMRCLWGACSMSTVITSKNCFGQENEDTVCVDGQNPLETSFRDHFGPYYGGIVMGSSGCPL